MAENNPRIKYEVDPHNRLISKVRQKETGVYRFRQVLEGTFKIGENNRLIYHLKKSADFRLPQEIKFSGNWSLDREHNLIFTLDKWNNQCEGNKLVIKGEIAKVEGGRLSFFYATRDLAGKKDASILELSGICQADKYNRLGFKVKREKDFYDTLTLSGIWQINQENQITYTYSKTLLKRKEKISRTLTLDGDWQINQRNRLTYSLSQDLDSGFTFQLGWQRAFPNRLECGLGVGVRPEERVVVLNGKWKFAEKVGIVFEMECAGKIKSLTFGANIKLDKRQRLDVQLRSRENQDLGITLTLSRKIFQGQGEAFLKALASGKEIAVFAGAGFRW